MAVEETSGVLAYVDEKGNVRIHYPVTKAENVDELDKYAVPPERTVNGKALSADIALEAGDVGARPDTWMPSVEDVGAAASDHTHDDRYYTETEMDTKLGNKSDTGHNHDDRYYTESEMDTKLAGKADTSHGTHVTYTTTAPVMDGTAAVGTAGTVARSDHVHPTDTSRAAASHAHKAEDITSGTLSSERLPTVPISKGGTGAETADAALENLGAYKKSAVDALVEELRAELVSGEVSAALETDGGVALLTDSGEELRATRTLASAETVATLVAAMAALTQSASRTKATADRLDKDLANALVAD
jgi:hypothetical protein